MGSVVSALVLGFVCEESSGGKVVVGKHVFLVAGRVDPLLDHLGLVIGTVVVGNVLSQTSESFWFQGGESG